MTNFPKRKYFVELPEWAKITANVNGSAEINIQYTDEEKMMNKNKSTLPEPTVMNWSTERPKFEEVKGKKIYVRWKDGRGEFGDDIRIIDNESYFGGTFDATFSRYAIIAESEPKPLWGYTPETVPFNVWSILPSITYAPSFKMIILSFLCFDMVIQWGYSEASQ